MTRGQALGELCVMLQKVNDHLDPRAWSLVRNCICHEDRFTAVEVNDDVIEWMRTAIDGMLEASRGQRADVPQVNADPAQAPTQDNQ